MHKHSPLPPVCYKIPSNISHSCRVTDAGNGPALPSLQGPSPAKTGQFPVAYSPAFCPVRFQLLKRLGDGFTAEFVSFPGRVSAAICLLLHSVPFPSCSAPTSSSASRIRPILFSLPRHSTSSPTSLSREWRDQPGSCSLLCFSKAKGVFVSYGGARELVKTRHSVLVAVTSLP